MTMRPGTSSDDATDNVTRIQCWSGPRNVSTALMYAWRQRADTTVYDEPFYAHYLNLTARDHPMFDEVVAAQSTDVSEVIDEVILGPIDTPVYFMKQMAHHLHGVPRGWLHRTENILLTRDPRDMLRSLSVQLPDCGLADTGLVEQVELLDAVLNDGGSPVVIDSRLLLEDPAGVLARVCERLGLEFDGRDAVMAGRTQTRRRRLGARLVCVGAHLDRLFAVSALEPPDTGSTRPDPRRGTPALRTTARVRALTAALVRGHSAATCRTSLRRCGLLRRLER